jgi:Tfp pilus assembly protein PilV
VFLLKQSPDNFRRFTQMNRIFQPTDSSKFQRRRHSGVMLLDALLALTLAVVIIMACIALSISSLAAHEVAKQQNIATNAARKVVENLRAFKQTAVSPGEYPDASAFGSVPQLELLTTGTAGLSITRVRGTLKLAVVTVRWQSGIPRRMQSLSIATYMAKEGFTQ